MKNIHLLISALLVVPIAITYGFAPDLIWPLLFDFKVDTADLHNILKAVMGLYISVALVWMWGTYKPRYWETATILNIVFMAGLAAGRIISFALDGMPSVGLLVGFGGEIGLAILAYYNWKKYSVQ